MRSTGMESSYDGRNVMNYGDEPAGNAAAPWGQGA